MEKRGSESVVDSGKPAGPVDALLKRSFHGCHTVQMLQLVYCVGWQPALLPERAREEQGQEGDEEERAQVTGKSIRQGAPSTGASAS